MPEINATPRSQNSSRPQWLIGLLLLGVSALVWRFWPSQPEPRRGAGHGAGTALPLLGGWQAAQPLEAARSTPR